MASSDRKYIGAIDQGTHGSRFEIFQVSGLKMISIASHQEPVPHLHPHVGWAEQAPELMVTSVRRCIEAATAEFVDKGHDPSKIEAVGLATQRETTLVWDAETGEPLYNAVSWLDIRTKSTAREFKPKDNARRLQSICGLPLSTYSSAIKLVWLLQNVPDVKNAYDEGRLAFGTVDAWLLYRLNGGPKGDIFATDVTNASRTMFMDLRKLEYDDRIFEFFHIDRSKIHLPRIAASADPEAFGELDSGPLAGVPITSCLGNQSASLVGHGAFDVGEAKNTYGTGAFLMYNVGEAPIFSRHQLLATVAYHLGPGHKPVYALEGSVAVAGAAVQFLTDNLGMFRDPTKVSEAALTVPDNGGCVFVTAFSGLLAPYWIDTAEGAIFGVTQRTKRGHIARATLEATCFQTKAILESMERDSGQRLSHLAVDGGMSSSDVFIQTLANITGTPVNRPATVDTTALGAAAVAGLAVGIWKTVDELKGLSFGDPDVFEPDISTREQDKMYKKWGKAVSMSKGWTDSDSDDE